MAFVQVKKPVAAGNAKAILSIGILALGLASCAGHKKVKVYKSDCDINIQFKKVNFSQLVNHIDDYDQQYVEVIGKYKEGSELSALFSDSLFFDHSDTNALWVNFSQDCPLYLTGTKIGLFEVNDGQFIPINNKKVTIRGKIDLRNKGHLNHYKGTIDHVSLVDF